jgi:hypothetical protein
VVVRKRAIPATRKALLCLPVGSESPCELSKAERAVVVMFMSCTKLEWIAGYKPWKFVYELRYRIGAWSPLARSKASAINNFRYKDIALAVIAHAKNELAELSKPDAPTE